MIICSQACPCCPSLSLDSPSPTQWGHLMIYLPFPNPEHPATDSRSRQAFRILRKPSPFMKILTSRLRYPQFPVKVPWHSWQMAGFWEHDTRSQWAVNLEQTVACEEPGAPPGQDQGLYSQGAWRFWAEMWYISCWTDWCPRTSKDRQVEPLK